MNILTNLNLGKNELQNARIQNLAVAPANAVVGQIYFDTVDNKLKVYDGSSWNAVGADYTLPIATSSVLGGILAAIKGNNDTVEVSIDANGKLYVPTYPTLQSLGAIANTEKGASNGVATLDSSGKIPSSQLPSYVDDVIEGYYDESQDAFFEDEQHTSEITPEAGKIYVDITDGPYTKAYRWAGHKYYEISETPIHKYTETITGNDVTTAFTIRHNLGEKDVIVNIYDATTDEEIITDITRTSPSILTVSFAAAPATGTRYRVVIIA